MQYGQQKWTDEPVGEFVGDFDPTSSNKIYMTKASTLEDYWNHLVNTAINYMKEASFLSDSSENSFS